MTTSVFTLFDVLASRTKSSVREKHLSTCLIGHFELNIQARREGGATGAYIH